MLLPDKPLILFDGVCNLCNSSVQFIIKHDTEKKFLFASLQSEIGQAVLKHFELDTTDFNTFILVENYQAYTKSTGVLRVIKQFSGLWKFLYIFIAIPSPIRDFFYTFVSQNRYKIFGKKDHCMIPSPDLKSRFLN